MNDHFQAGDATPCPNEWLKQYFTREAARSVKADELHPVNKLVLFTVLAAAGVANVSVMFDGYGDSGQIESVDAYGADGELPLPEGEIELVSPTHDGADVVVQTHPIREAIEELCYAFLESTHSGWENNDGAYGEFVFDVGTGTISLDHNDRYTAITSYTHEW